MNLNPHLQSLAGSSEVKQLLFSANSPQPIRGLGRTENKMNVEQKMIDYAQAAEQLGKSSKDDWFDPQPGRYQVELLSEAISYEGKFKGEVKPKVRFEVRVVEENGKRNQDARTLSWGVNVASGIGSLYGQLVLLGREKGHLAGETVQLMVKKAEGKRDFTILEAQDIINRLDQEKAAKAAAFGDGEP